MFNQSIPNENSKGANFFTIKEEQIFIQTLSQFTLNEPYQLVRISIVTSLGFESFKYKRKI